MLKRYPKLNTLRTGRRRGLALIELILALIVIAILTSWYFNSGGGGAQQAASQYQHSMDRSKAAACQASRTALRTAILTQTMQNPGPITTESLQRANINVNVCPEGGIVSPTPDGTLVCSIHQP